jgi:hypothetical protein
MARLTRLLSPLAPTSLRPQSHRLGRNPETLDAFRLQGVKRGNPMAEQAKQLDDLFEGVLRDIYYAEKKILTAHRLA